MTKGVMIAGYKSGSGKTVFTCGLLAALKKRNISVRSFKSGPDYIDPMFHRSVLGIKSGNLDSFFCDGDMLCALYSAESAGFDFALTEGAMGIYDGAGIRDEGSCYDVALKLSLPVIFIADCSGMGKTVVSVIKGVLLGDRANLIKGVVLNNISGRYFNLIKPLIEEETRIRVVGYLPKMSDVAFESRYLGLRMPKEIEDINRRIERILMQVNETVNIDAIIDIAKGAAPKIKPPQITKQSRVKLAVARDEAFCFYYEENITLLRELGAEILYFSPLHDLGVPKEAEGIYIGGGYPELYAKELSDNEKMRISINSAINGGMPSFAECGGFMYLQDELEKMPMVGQIRSASKKKQALVRFGYVNVQTDRESFLPEGEIIKGHEFHYYDSDDNGSDALVTKASDNEKYRAVFAAENHWWGYPHLYLPSNVHFAERFLESCLTYGKKMHSGQGL